MSKIELRYASINAKIKGMYSNRLKIEDYEELLKQNTVKDSVMILKNKFDVLDDINDNLDRIQLEKELNRIMLIDFEKILRILDEKSKNILYVYIKKYEIIEIKAIFRDLLGTVNIDNFSKKIVVFSNIYGLNNVKNINQFMYSIKNTDYYNIFFKYYESNTLKENMLKIETELDKLYFNKIYTKLKSKEKAASEIIGAQIDLTNILLIYRAKKYHNFSDEKIQKFIIDIYYKLNKRVVQEFITKKTIEYFIDSLSKTIYKGIFDKEELIELNVKKYLYKLYRKYFTTENFNISIIISYLGLKDIEIKNIINIIEGVRYNLKKDDIKNKIVL